MTETIPTWWLILSGVFFFMNILLFGAMSFAIIKLVQLATAMKPKLESLETNVQGLVVKVQGIAEKIEELTATVQTTVAKLGGNAVSVGGNAQIVAQNASKQMNRVSPFVIGAVAAIRVVKALNDVRVKRSTAKVVKEEKKKSNANLNHLGTVLQIATHFLKR